MHRTVYIDVDEEITSIIDRIRSEEATDIFLVIPKDAALTHGVINLKILKKEVEDMGKTIIINTNDPHAKKVIERVGIRVGALSEEARDQKAVAGGAVAQAQTEQAVADQASEEAMKEMDQAQKMQEPQKAVGSSSFFDEETPEEKKTGAAVRVGAAATAGAVGKSQPTDMLHQEQLKKDLYNRPAPQPTNVPVKGYETARRMNAKPAVAVGIPAAAASRATKPAGPAPGPGALMPGRPPQGPPPPPHQMRQKKEKDTHQKAEQFFSSDPVSQRPQEPSKPHKEKIDYRTDEEKTQTHSKKKKTIVVLSIILILAFFSFWIYSNYPKVLVKVYPVKKEVAKEIKVMAKGSGQLDIGNAVVAGKSVEVVIKKEVEFDATGETYGGDDGKAKGQVTIYNNYSAASQPLVATTRVLSKEGKLFRLTEGVTVPGMSGDKAGAVTVSVIADKPGEDFNIGVSTFTIEGFKGNLKYEKFEAKSVKAMIGGGTADASKKVSMVTAGDIENARKKTLEELENSLDQEIGQQLGEGKKIIIDSAEMSIEKAQSSHKEGATTNKFAYSVEQKIKAIAFSKEEVDQVVVAELEKEIGSGYELDLKTQVGYKKGIADFNENSLTIYVEARTVAWPTIDLANVKSGVVGNGEEKIKQFLINYEGLDRAEIIFVPSWMSMVPTNDKKVQVEEVREL